MEEEEMLEKIRELEQEGDRLDLDTETRVWKYKRAGFLALALDKKALLTDQFFEIAERLDKKYTEISGKKAITSSLIPKGRCEWLAHTAAVEGGEFYGSPVGIERRFFDMYKIEDSTELERLVLRIDDGRIDEMELEEREFMPLFKYLVQKPFEEIMPSYVHQPHQVLQRGKDFEEELKRGGVMKIEYLGFGLLEFDHGEKTVMAKAGKWHPPPGFLLREALKKIAGYTLTKIDGVDDKYLVS